MTLVINLPGASGSKAQMVAPRGVVSVTVPVTLLVTLCSWKSLSASGARATLAQVAGSVLFLSLSKVEHYGGLALIYACEGYTLDGSLRR